MYIETANLREEVSWLEHLQKAVSEDSELRLTIEEWEKLLSIAPQFAVAPHSAQWGFNFGITLWYEANSIDGPKPVFTMSGQNLPDGMGHTFNATWDALSPLSHNQENEKLLAHYEMDPPREKSFYNY
jgi:hypothetical protein